MKWIIQCLLMSWIVQSPEPIHAFLMNWKLKKWKNANGPFSKNGISLWNCNCNSCITICYIHTYIVYYYLDEKKNPAVRRSLFYSKKIGKISILVCVNFVFVLGDCSKTLWIITTNGNNSFYVYNHLFPANFYGLKQSESLVSLKQLTVRSLNETWRIMKEEIIWLIIVQRKGRIIIWIDKV